MDGAEAEVAAVKSFRDDVATLYRFEVSKIENGFHRGLSELNALVGVEGGGFSFLLGRVFRLMNVWITTKSRTLTRDGILGR